MFAAHAHLTVATLRQFELGQTNSRHHISTERSLCEALGWPSDSIDRLREGSISGDELLALPAPDTQRGAAPTKAQPAANLDLGEQLAYIRNGVDQMKDSVAALARTQVEIDSRVRLTESGLGAVLGQLDQHEGTLAQVVTRLDSAERQLAELLR